MVDFYIGRAWIINCDMGRMRNGGARMSNEQYQVVDEAVEPTLCIKTQTSVDKLPEEIGNAYQSIMSYLAERGETVSGMPYVAYFNLDMENLEVEMGFPVGRTLPGRGEIQPGEIPGGKKAVTMYKGPYQEMAPAYDGLIQWMKEQNMEPKGVAYEFYYNSPGEVPESELLTKIVFPLK
jgi:effector-binding domain-containing protein